MTFKEVLNQAKSLGLCSEEVVFLQYSTAGSSCYYVDCIIVSPSQAKKVANLLGLSFVEVLWAIFLHELGHACDQEFIREDELQILLEEVVAWDYAQELLPLSPLGEKAFQEVRDWALANVANA